MMTKAKQIKLLMDCAAMLARNKTCNENNFLKWWQIVKYAHFKGYLYTGFNGDSIDLVCIAFRTPKIYDGIDKKIPHNEKGRILYVIAIASESKDRMKLYRLMKWYLREHPNVTTIAFNYRNNEKVQKIHKIRRPNHGKQLKT